MRTVHFLVALLAAVITTSILEAQTRIYLKNGLRYTFPSSHSAGVLTNNGSGTLTWGAGGITSNMIAFTTDGSCPAGWAEYVEARGMYFVGLPSSGTNLGTSGTALTGTADDRASGQHTHAASLSVGALTDGGHTHGITEPNGGTGHRHTGVVNAGSAKFTDLGASDFYLGGDVNTGSSATNVSINNATIGNPVASTTINNTGTGTGTNAPAIFLLACKKS